MTSDEITSLEEFLALSEKAKRTAQEERRIQAAKYFQELVAELDRIMPEVGKVSYAYNVPMFKCRICGGAVLDRVTHLRWHRGSEMSDVLTALFGRPN